jgi:hypothetical protein
MCVFTGVLASGKALSFQLITFFSILVAMGAWIWIFVKNGLGPQLRLFLLPICLWFVFGTLDILITVEGTYANPLSEANPATRILLVQFGPWGAALASALWISLWAGIVYALNKTKPGRAAEFVSLAIFYSLAAGHFLGFASWFGPLCAFGDAITNNWFFPAALADMKVILIGMALAALHCALACNRRGEKDNKASQ